jgi:fucose permease
MTLLQPMMVAVLVVGGMGVALLGSIKVPLAKRLQIDEVRVGGLVSIFGFTIIPVIVLAGFLTDLDRQIVLVSGGILMAFSLNVLARALNYLTAFVGVILISAAWAMMINVANVLTPLAFPGSEATATNLGNVFFGIGAFLTPLGVTALIRRTSLLVCLSLVGALTLIPVLLALAVDFDALKPPVQIDTPGGSRSTTLLDPMLLICGLALFFYGPLEASLGAWATTYLGEQGVKETTATNFLSAFWLTFMAARLITAFTLPERQEATLIFVLALLTVALLTAMVLCRSRQLALALVVAAGLIFGPIFPTVMGVLLGHFDSSLHGRAVGLFFAIGGIGWTTIPILIGAYARRTSLQRGFRIAVAAAIGLSVVAGIMFVR